MSRGTYVVVSATIFIEKATSVESIEEETTHDSYLVDEEVSSRKGT